MGSATLTNAVATHVTATAPTTNLDYSAALVSRTGGAGAVISYLYFPRPFPLKSTILSAKIKFYTTTMAENVTHTFTFQRLGVAFSASKVTYNTRPTNLMSGTKPSTKTGVIADKTEWEIDVTDWMQTVANGGLWYGVQFQINEALLRYVYSEVHPLTAYRPRFEVSWSDAPATPSGLAPSGGRKVGVSRPTVRANYVDVSGSTQLQAIQVQTNASDSWGAPAFDSGTVLTSVPELNLAGTAFTAMTDGQTVFWRVRFQDAAGIWSGWSAAASFQYDIKGTLTLNSPPLGAPAQATAAVTENTTAILGSLRPSGGSPPVWQAVTQQVNGTGTTSVCAYPGTVAANDILLWQQYIEPDTSSITPPDGTWTKLVQIDADDDSGNQQWWYKRAAGGETGSVTFTHASVFRRASLHRFSGAITTGSPFEEIVSAASVGDSFVTPIVGITTSADRLLVLGGTSNTGTGQSWTPPAGYTERLDAGHIVVATKTGAVSSPIIEDATPPILWGFTGETQAAYQIQIAHLQNNVWVTDWDSGKVSSSATSVTVPAGKINEPSSTVYTLTLRVWDTKSREATPGDPTYVEVVRNFTFVPGAATGTTGLTAVAQAPRPKVVLTWQRATAPDRFNILRNGKVIAAALDPAALFTTGTSYSYTDQSPSPGRALTYTVQAVVNNVASTTNASAVVTVNSSGIWLREPETGLEVCLFGDDDRDFTLAEEASALRSIAQNSVAVGINQSLGGLEGRIEGALEDMYGKTAQEWRDQLIKMRDLRVKRFWLTVGDFTFQVIAQKFSYTQRGNPTPRFRAGFDVYQQDSVSKVLLGS